MKIKEIFQKYKEIIMYLIMGVATTLVNWITYMVIISFFNQGDGLSTFIEKYFKLSIEPNSLNVFVSNAIAWIVAVIFAYITNKIFVFESKTWTVKAFWREFSLFISARAITGILEIFGVPLLVEIGLDQTILGYEGMVSKAIVSVAVIILNYIFSKLIIFKKNTKK